MPSLLFGPHPQRIERGRFTCPECAQARSYDRVVVRRTFRLLGVRLPFGRLGEYVECGECRSTFRPEVLAYDAGADTPAVMSEYQRVMRRLLALMVVSDGTIAEPEIQMMQEVFEAVSGRSLPRSEVLEEARAAARTPATAARYLAGMVGHLNDYGKEQVLRAAALISRSDGQVHVRERELLVRLAAVLRAPPESVGMILREPA